MQEGAERRDQPAKPRLIVDEIVEQITDRLGGRLDAGQGTVGVLSNPEMMSLNEGR
jgi:hypothetical protein